MLAYQRFFTGFNIESYVCPIQFYLNCLLKAFYVGIQASQWGYKSKKCTLQKLSMTNGLGQLRGMTAQLWTACSTHVHRASSLVLLNSRPSHTILCIYTKGQHSAIMSLTLFEEHATGSYISILFSCTVSFDNVLPFSSSIFSNWFTETRCVWISAQN